MSDRELLELAAKAAGKLIVGDAGDDVLVCRDDGRSSYFWSPLSDDGDALRLAVKLKIEPKFTQDWVLTGVAKISEGHCMVVQEPLNKDFYAATRRAIVRAAAEIGRSMQ